MWVVSAHISIRKADELSSLEISKLVEKTITKNNNPQGRCENLTIAIFFVVKIPLKTRIFIFYDLWCVFMNLNIMHAYI